MDDQEKLYIVVFTDGSLQIYNSEREPGHFQDGARCFEVTNLDMTVAGFAYHVWSAIQSTDYDSLTGSFKLLW